MINEKLIDEIKKVIGFNEVRSCNNCAKCSKFEENLNAPIVLTCNHAGAITFEVSQNDSCKEWEEF